MASSAYCAAGLAFHPSALNSLHRPTEPQCHQSRGSGDVSTSYSRCALRDAKPPSRSLRGLQRVGLQAIPCRPVNSRLNCRSIPAMHAAAVCKSLASETTTPETPTPKDTESREADGNRQNEGAETDGPAGTSRWVAQALAIVAGALLALQEPQMALAGMQKVGEFTGSGFIFKDSIEVLSIDDPKVTGVTIFVSDFQRSLTDRLAKDFFNEPSQASITCAQTSPLKIVGKISGKEGEEIFQETKNFLAFKTLHVRRIFDEKKNALVYVAYSTRFQTDNDKVSAGRYRTSICTVPLFSAVVQNDAGAPGDGSG